MEIESNSNANINNNNAIAANSTNDLEKNIVEGTTANEEQAFDINREIRRGFIKKVYGILSIQLLLTVLVSSFTINQGFKKFIFEQTWMVFLCLGLNLTTMITLICSKKYARTVPINYILLIIFTLSEAYLVASICAVADYRIVLTAAGLTAVVTLALTIYAINTESDITMLGGVLFASLTILVFLTLVSFFLRLDFIYYICCGLGALVYSVYLVYDTQLIMGKFGNDYQVDDYILAALMIYIDIIQIFVELLRLLSNE